MVLKHLPQEYLGPTSTVGESLTNEVNEEWDLSKPTKIIGTLWDPSADTLSFPYQKLVEEPITYSKRGVSKIIASIYDVNGELAPFILRGKVILSLVWSYERPKKDTEIGSPKSI